MKQNRSSRDWSFRIKDILQAIENIEKYTAKMTFLQFKKNQLVMDAVIRNFEIIGEASNHIPKAIQTAHPSIPWRQMIALRNFLIHEYFGIDFNTVWQTARTHLPALKDALKDLLKHNL
jgi:uncharacterized protein with HEPN domain